MMDLATLPEIQSYFMTGISVHGTGFQSDLWLGNLAVFVFVAWCFRSGGKKALILAIVPAALLAMATPGANAAPFPDYSTDPLPHPTGYVSSFERIPMDGMGVTPLVIFAVLLWVVTSGKQPEKTKPKKPSKPESDPMAEVMAAMLRNKKALIPAVPLLAMLPAVGHAAGSPSPATNGAAVGWAMIGTFAVFGGLKALANRRYLLALALSILFFLGAVGTMTNASADLWESDGERAIREAEAERIRLEAQAAYQRELALLRSQGHAAPAAPAGRGPAVAFWAFAGIAALAILWAYIENRWREAREAEIRALKKRLEIAERDRFPALPPFGSLIPQTWGREER